MSEQKGMKFLGSFSPTNLIFNLIAFRNKFKVCFLKKAAKSCQISLLIDHFSRDRLLTRKKAFKLL